MGRSHTILKLCDVICGRPLTSQCPGCQNDLVSFQRLLLSITPEREHKDILVTISTNFLYLLYLKARPFFSIEINYFITQKKSSFSETVVEKIVEHCRRAKPDPDPRPVTGFQFKTLKLGPTTQEAFSYHFNLLLNSK